MCKCEKGEEQERICKLCDIDICDCCVHGIKSNKEELKKEELKKKVFKLIKYVMKQKC